MKIAMFGQRAFGSRLGGIDIVVTRLSCSMARRGHEIICYDRCRAPEVRSPAGIRVKRVPAIPGKGLEAVSSAFFAAIGSSFSSAQVVHIHGEGPAFFCPLPRLLGKRVVVTIHGLDWQREKWSRGFGKIFIRWGERMTVRHAHSIVVLSQAMAKYFWETYHRETILIPNGMDSVQPLAASQITAHYGLEKDSYLLFVGRLVPEKGIHHLIRAYRNLSTDKRLVIAGAESDSREYVRQLHMLAAGDPRILFTGFVQGQLLAELYSNASLYILPSRLEGMPLSLLEALSYGCRCLASDIPECAQILKDPGRLFPPGDEEALLQHLQRFCEDPDYGRNTVSRPLFMDWETVTEKTLEVYR